MKRYISILLCMAVALVSFSAFAKTVDISVDYEKVFTDLDTSYSAEDDGWITWSNNRTQDIVISDNKAHIYQKSGSKATGLFASGKNLRMIYSKNLGESFAVNGSYYHYENGLKIYFNAELDGNDYKSGFYMNIPNGNELKLMYKNGSEDTLLASWTAPTKYAQNFVINPYTVTYENGIARITLGSGGTMFDSGELNIASLAENAGLAEYNKTGYFGFGSQDANFLTLKEIAIHGKRVVEVGEMSIIPLSSQNGVNAESVVSLAFSGQISREDLLDNISVTDASVIDAVVSSDGYKADIYLEGIESGREYTLTISEDMTSYIEEYLNEDFVFDFTSESILSSYNIELNAPADTDVLYGDYRFENDFTYTGKITLSAGEGYIYFNADKNSDGDVYGMRIAVTPKSEGVVRLEEKSVDGKWNTVCESSATLDAGEGAYFNLTYSDGAVSFCAVSAGGSASLICDGITYKNGFAGIGSASTAVKSENLCVQSDEQNAYEKVKIVSASAPFNGYAVYGKNDTAKVTAELNKSADEILSAELYVDGKRADEFVNEDGMLRASLPKLDDGVHKAYVLITDKFNTAYKIESGYFCTGKGSFIPNGFTAEGEKISSLSDALGKSVTAEFAYSYSGTAVVIACLYDESGKLCDIRFADGDGSSASVEIAVPSDADGYTLKAFMCESFASSAPLSGIMELK